ncbi:polysaccharide deacetylase family protein [Paenibacillus ihumii]|uniref:polysaccharide deacetylase family protein n=1 Tax=Paenibacillus ihumii TaxID=687436 RepID=UPI0006D809B9|nr:polysaccharide deacetylase family protein [Paenibacillus ihumii]
MQTGNTNRLGRGWIQAIFVLGVCLILSSCSIAGDRNIMEGNEDSGTKQPIERYTGAPSQAISSVYTTGRELALTFNGMADSDTMNKLLDQLDGYGIKATFFLPGMRVAEEPDIAREIKSRGHEIENNTLNGQDLSQLSYEQVYQEIHLANQVIQKETGITPRYVRTASGEYNDDIRLAAAHNGQKAVISHSLFLHNWNKESEAQKRSYIRKYINRGGIIALDAGENKQLLEDIAFLADAAKDAGYTFVPLSKLVMEGGERKPLEQIAGYDAARLNASHKPTSYNLVSREETNSKKVALTFDDWGTDYTITQILDILEKYQVKASFFLRADGVEKNPNLARAIAKAGHDVGNHTYSHPELANLTPEQLQNEVVKAHQIITEAIQEKPAMLFRPPTGNITPEAAEIIAATGYHTIVNFDVDPKDWDRSRSAAQITQSIMEQTKSGSIILLHILDDLQTIEALPQVIESLEGQGYTFVRASDLLS